jgi:hypothetical protein
VQVSTTAILNQLSQTYTFLWVFYRLGSRCGWSVPAREKGNLSQRTQSLGGTLLWIGERPIQSGGLGLILLLTELGQKSYASTFHAVNSEGLSDPRETGEAGERIHYWCLGPALALSKKGLERRKAAVLEIPQTIIDKRCLGPMTGTTL